ncbi:response regulator [Nocardioides sp.]|uniref:response regulator n=1 Tax=Nocardioides sp. TaxID=35761 RepID=UPI00286A306E|nr:response regulator [Nocardioides sp.]
MKVLVADDNEDVRFMMSTLLQFRGWVVHTATSGQEALDLLGSDDYDAAVLDQTMPPLSGLEVAGLRRAAGDDTPFVLWTGWSSELDRDEITRCGVIVMDKSDVNRLPAMLEALAAGTASR